MSSAAQMVLNPQRRSLAAEKLLSEMKARVVGQETALGRIVDAYQMYLAGLASPRRPIASFLLLGPTGTGKTRVVEALAESLFANPRALIKVDCAEFQHSHEIAKLIGSPPGYLGHRETHPVLSQQAIDEQQTPETPISLVLFDEVEKASDALWQLLLGVLDQATLTLGDNHKVDFSRCFIFLTSNLGAMEMQKLLDPGFGFASASPPAAVQEPMTQAAMVAARRKFSPEFFNRLDHIVVFHPLDGQQLNAILDLELEQVRTRMAHPAAGCETIDFQFRCTPAARQFLLDAGTDARYGARPLKRIIERALVMPLASLLSTGQIANGDRVTVGINNAGNGLEFFREAAAG